MLKLNQPPSLERLCNIRTIRWLFEIWKENDFKVDHLELSDYKRRLCQRFLKDEETFHFLGYKNCQFLNMIKKTKSRILCYRDRVMEKKRVRVSDLLNVFLVDDVIDIVLNYWYCIYDK